MEFIKIHPDLNCTESLSISLTSITTAAIAHSPFPILPPLPFAGASELACKMVQTTTIVAVSVGAVATGILGEERVIPAVFFC